MFASAAEYYRMFPNGESDHEDGSHSSDDVSVASVEAFPMIHVSERFHVAPFLDRGKEDVVCFDDLPGSTLRLSGAMLAEDALNCIQSASQHPRVKELTCLNLGLDGLLDDHDDIRSSSWARLLRSRNWKQINLFSCKRVGLLFDLAESVTIDEVTIHQSCRSDLAGIEKIACAIENSQIKKMEIWDSGITGTAGSKGMETLAPALTQLKSLEITLTSEKHSALLCEAIKDNSRQCLLEEMDITDSSIPDAATALLLESLFSFSQERNEKNPSSRIRSLELCGESQTLHVLAQGRLVSTKIQSPASNCSLRKLVISNNDLSDMKLEGLLEFFEALSQPGSPVSMLESLDMENYMIHDDEMKALVASLTSPTCKLKELDLHGCGLTAAGIQQFGMIGVPQMHSLRKLGMPQDAASSIMAALGTGRNTRLEELEFNLGTSTETKYLLNLNRAGRQLIVSQEDDPPCGLWPIVLSRIQRVEGKYCGCGKQAVVESMWYFLRNKVLLEL